MSNSQHFPDAQQRIAELEQALQAAQQRITELEPLQQLVEHALDGISIANLDGQITYTNESFRKMSGFDQRTGPLHITNMYSAQEMQRIIQEGASDMAQYGSWTGRVQAQRPDGSQWSAQVSASLLHDTSGAVQAQAAIFRDITAQQQQEARLRLFESLVEHSTDAVIVTDAQGITHYVNPTAVELSHVSEQDLLNKPLSALWTVEEDEDGGHNYISRVREDGRWRGQFWATRHDSTRWRVDAAIMRLHAADESFAGTAIMARDVSQQHAAEQERAQLQEQVIMAQQAALRELSTPLIPLADEVIAMPLVGSIDSSRASQVMETLLEGIVTHQTSFAILDITGVRVVDTQVANALLRVAQAAKLLGTQVILTGIGAEVAMALTHLGADLSGIITRSNLQSGIAYAMETREL